MNITLSKPLIGQPCNHCGMCCKLQVCRNGAYILGLVSNLGDTVPGPCPAVVSKPGGQWVCGIALTPNRYIKRPYPAAVLTRHFKNLIGSGLGCDELGENPTTEQEHALTQRLDCLTADTEFIKKVQQSAKIIHGI